MSPRKKNPSDFEQEYRDFYDYDLFVSQGASYYNVGQYQRAIEDYDKAIELDPNNDRTYQQRGDCYVELGQYQRAIEDYGKAIELDPNNAIDLQ